MDKVYGPLRTHARCAFEGCPHDKDIDYVLECGKCHKWWCYHHTAKRNEHGNTLHYCPDTTHEDSKIGSLLNEGFYAHGYQREETLPCNLCEQQTDSVRMCLHCEHVFCHDCIDRMLV